MSETGRERTVNGNETVDANGTVKRKMGIELRHTDKIGAALLVALAVGIFAVTADFPTGPHETGPAYYPRVIAVLIAFFALVLLGRSVYRDGVRAHRIERDVTIRVVATLGLVVAYVLSLPWLGFVPGTIAFLVVAMRYSGVRSSVRIGLAAVGLTLLLYYTFVILLRIPLPRSYLFPVRELLPGAIWASTIWVGSIWGP